MPTSTQDFEPSDKARKDKKKKQHKDKRDSINPATGVNKAEVGDHRKRTKDISDIMYYSCNKKKHYLNKCLEPQKPEN